MCEISKCSKNEKHPTIQRYINVRVRKWWKCFQYSIVNWTLIRVSQYLNGRLKSYLLIIFLKDLRGSVLLSQRDLRTNDRKNDYSNTNDDLIDGLSKNYWNWSLTIIVNFQKRPYRQRWMNFWNRNALVTWSK